jgi:hypothetical protein
MSLPPTPPHVNQLVLPPPSPLSIWNHRVSGIFLTWSLNLKDLYQSILE